MSSLRDMKILFLSADSDSLIPELEQLLAQESGQDFEFFDDLTLDLDKADLIFMDYELLEFDQQFYDVLKQKEKVALVITDNDYDQINRILYETGVNHLLSSVEDMQELILTHARERRWSSSDFLEGEVTETQLVLSSSVNVGDQIEKLLEGHDFSHCFNDLKSYVSFILDEAISNALFNAPVDSLGWHPYKGIARSTPVTMIPGKDVEVSILSDEKRIVIQVRDFYGSLSQNNLFDYLPNPGENRKDGMGLGMYLIFRYGQKFIINVEKNKYTENLIVLEKSKRFKTYDQKEKSFHLVCR